MANVKMLQWLYDKCIAENIKKGGAKCKRTKC